MRAPTSGGLAPHALALAVGLSACANPAVDARIEALGEEPLPDLADFSYHRPGQPCVLCHGEYEEEEPIMTVAGTIFQTPTKRIPVENARVRVWDSSGGPPRDKLTNCVGNFWFTKEEWNPLFPLHIEVEYQIEGDDDYRVQPMLSRVGREGSCAGCHQDTSDPHTQFSPGRVFCSGDEATKFRRIREDCPVPPPVDTTQPPPPDAGAGDGGGL
jgi:hypothetical protein